MSQPAPYKHLLLATDFSESCAAATRLTARLAQRLGARVTITHVFDASPFRFGFAESREELARRLAQAADRELSELLREHFAEVPNTKAAAIEAESTPLAIAEFAEQQGVDLVVVGTHGRTGLARLIIGSVAENIVRHAGCDVLTVPPKTEVDRVPQRLLAATDFSPASGHALDICCQLGKALGAHTTLVHTFDPSVPVPSTGEKRREGPFMSIEALRAELEASLAETQRRHFDDECSVGRELLMSDSTAEGLVAYAKDDGSELMVIGSHGRSGMARFLIGSVAERVVRDAPCPVLTVRSHLGSAEQGKRE